ncbi:F-box only protein 22-like isoform X2 [Formica exsecta]|uniref:F-box only protein 22-like isoform X2 n=1 Tax=Formica exsecta TaxID=72781 RepID=UPI0011445D64|nr:F-box only protein 22-like isoform X2 [Formica exsecta]
MEEPTEKRIRKTSTGSENDGTSYESYENPMDSNIYLTYDILRIVFTYLNGMDLGRAAMVCRLWLEAANHEKYTRGPDCFIEHYLHFTGKTRCIEKSNIKPAIGFFFIPEKIPTNIKGWIRDTLPQNCKAIMLYTSGIIINKEEIEYKAFPNIVCALLPEAPNVKINSAILCTEYAARTYQHEFSLSLFEEHKKKLIDMIDETLIPNHDESTCLIFLCNDLKGAKMATLLASAIQEYSGEDRITSLWGGVVDNIIFSRPYEYCIAVLITGSIQSWSIVVDRRCSTKEQVIKRLRLFKNQVKLKKHSVGFMFACKARGCGMYDEKNVESTIFKTLFPEVPLVGCFGNGEFGKNTMPIDEMDKKKGKKDWYNQYSTIFMILTYG